MMRLSGPLLAVLGSTFAARALCGLRSFVNARWLGPELYGLWGSLSFLVSFAYHFHGGIQDVVARQIPISLGRGRGELARRTAQSGFSFFILPLLATAVLLWTAALLLPAQGHFLARASLAVGGIALPLEVLFFYEQTVARSFADFGRLNRSLLFSSAVSLLLTCWLVIAYGFYGLFVVAVVTPLAGLFWLRRRAYYPWKFRWEGRRLGAMFRMGWPILAMTLVYEALGWVDRFLVLGFAGVRGFGYYAFAGMVAQLCFLFPQVLASVVEPQIFYEYARVKGPEGLESHVRLPLKILSLTFPVGLAAADLVVPHAMALFFPDYAPAIPAVRILLWGCVFMGFIYNVKPFIVALGKQHQVLRFYATAVAVNAAVSVVLAAAGLGLAGIALGTVLAYAVCSLELLVFVFRHFCDSPAAIWRRIGALYLPAAGVFTGTVVIPWAVSGLAGGLPAVAVTALRAAVLAGCVLLLFAYRWKIVRQPVPAGVQA